MNDASQSDGEGEAAAPSTPGAPSTPASAPSGLATSPTAPASSPTAPASSPAALASSPAAPATSPAVPASSPTAPASSPAAPASSSTALATSPLAPSATPLLAAALKTWLRYVVPLTLLSAIALSPVIVVALRVRVPVDQAGSNATLRLGWGLLSLAWLGQLVLIGGAAAMTRARPSQWQALGGGLVRLVRAIVPCLVAGVAILVGGLALVAPGVVLLALLVLTGASDQRGVPAPLVDSIAFARNHPRAVVLAAAAMLGLDAAIASAAHLAFVTPLSRPPMPAQLQAARHFVHALAVALVIASPLPATVLATIRTRSEPSDEPETHGPEAMPVDGKIRPLSI